MPLFNDLIAGFFSFFEKIFMRKKIQLANMNSNVNAFLQTIKYSEGADYNMFFGGSTFSDYSKHPDIVHTIDGVSSTAAGAYQFLFSTWQDLQNRLQLEDFSPKNQDLAAIELINERNALQDVMNGNFQNAINKLRETWTSFKVRDIADLQNTFQNNGGQLA